MNSPKFSFGDRVTFLSNGRMITGVITYSFLNGLPYPYFCYHVRDDNGEYWHRDEEELKKHHEPLT
jgi:hypothetical protein